ncbi:unnamed protein product [Linum trigynum]|uniref:Gnk2-homologous domain-containing protein n=1 Tax=Linum trigynum TaxID=586398 RepID=A0AAV2DST6_9ROSI
MATMIPAAVFAAAVAVLVLGGSTICPFAEGKTQAVDTVPVLCNGRNFTGGELRQARAARDKVLGRLVSQTLSRTNKPKVCTTADDGGGKSTTIFGFASCATSKRCGGGGRDRCSTTFEDCSTCLGAARDLLKDVCSKATGGQVDLKIANPKCFMRFESTEFC